MTLNTANCTVKPTAAQSLTGMDMEPGALPPVRDGAAAACGALCFPAISSVRPHRSRS
jgi:hypothetical protein